MRWAGVISIGQARGLEDAVAPRAGVFRALGLELGASLRVGLAAVRSARWCPPVARLPAVGGIKTLTALALDLELGGDWPRFI